MSKYLLLFFIFLILIIILYCIYFHYNYENNINKRKSVDYKTRRKILINLYNIIIDAAEATNTKPFLIYGTLLGFIRNKDLICYDYDLDFGIENSQYDAILQYLVNYIKNFPEYKIEVKDFLHYKNVEIIHIDTRLSADISGFTLENNMYSRDVFKLYSRYYLKEKCVDIPKNWIMPLRFSTFLNRNTYVPNMPKKLLSCYYGKNFITPDHSCNSDCSVCTKIN